MYLCVVVANEIVNKVTQMKIILGVESAKYSLGNVSNQGFYPTSGLSECSFIFGENHCWLRS